MLHNAGKPKKLVGSWKPLILTSCLGKILETAEANNLSNWAESYIKFNRQKNGFRNNRNTNDNLYKLLKTIRYGFHKGHLITGIFLDVKKAFN